MKKTVKKLTALAGTFILLLGSLTACGGNAAAGGAEAGGAAAQTSSAESQEAGSSGVKSSGAQAEAQPDQEAGLSGSLQMVGSTSMEKLANALSEAFMLKYPEVTVTAEFVGSSAGVEAVLAGTSDIGNSSRNLTEEEKEKGAVENIVAIDGIAVCVDPSNTVEGLTRQQLSDLFTGKVTNWSEVGGEDAPVIVVGREAGSGTRGAFEEILEIKDQCVYSNELDSTGGVMAKIASTPGTVGYVSLDALDGSVKALKLDDVEATAENIKAGSYFLSRPFVMATKGEISALSELAQAWFAFVMGEEGQQIAADTGLIGVSAEKAQ